MHLRINCKRTHDPAPHRTTRVTHQSTTERNSNRTLCAWQASTAVDTPRFAFFTATPKHGVRSRTAASAPQPLHGAMFGCAPANRKVRCRTWPLVTRLRKYLRKLKVFMSKTGHEPESFPDRIIFSTISNDITNWRQPKVQAKMSRSSRRSSELCCKIQIWLMVFLWSRIRKKTCRYNE